MCACSAATMTWAFLYLNSTSCCNRNEKSMLYMFLWESFTVTVSVFALKFSVDCVKSEWQRGVGVNPTSPWCSGDHLV